MKENKADEQVEEVLKEAEKEITAEEKQIEEEISSWKPKTKVGKLVKDGKIKDIDDLLEKYKILEKEIIDALISTKSDLLAIGQAKGKFGGGKRRVWRQTQRKTAEGNVPTFSCMAVVGDGDGHVGIGLGKAKETLPAREKAIRTAKLSLIKIARGCGSFDCSCNDTHSIPFKVEGKCGSSRLVLYPAPQGTGLVVGDEVKKILKLAGIKDIYCKTFGQTRSTINLAKACINALEKTGGVRS
ncbi:30S ribosomal protein S5 [archaeon]|nr:30S ribosomal protein S5 [archaeon]